MVYIYRYNKFLNKFLAGVNRNTQKYDTIQYAIEYSSPVPDKSKCEAKVKESAKEVFTELTGRFITRKTIFVCCSQKVVLRGRTTAPLKICLRGQIFVPAETSRSHLAWSTDDRNLTDFLLIKTNLSKFCPKCDLCHTALHGNLTVHFSSTWHRSWSLAPKVSYYCSIGSVSSQFTDFSFL